MLEPAQLSRYFKRIGHGPVGAKPEALASLAAAHCRAIPFENLDAYLGRRVSLDPAAVFLKLVDSGRGGWCFEQNLLFGNVLRALGFQVADLAARVLWGRGVDAVMPRTHRALLVRAGGAEWLVDVGFGGQSLCGALAMVDEGPQSVGHDVFRLERLPGGERLLWVDVRGEWQPMYRFDLHPQLPVDFEAANFQLCMDPASHFTHMLMLSRAGPEGRHVLRDRELGFHQPGAETMRRGLCGPGEVLAALRDVFGLRLDGETRRALEARLAAQAGATPAFSSSPSRS